jgi:hypothetical protein
MILCVFVWGENPEADYLGTTTTLKNEWIEVGVSLKIGRIVSCHRKGEAEWIQTFNKPAIPSWHWNPWGGSYLWPTVQSLWEQIYPKGGVDPVIDGTPWELLKKSDQSLEMRSGISPELGLRVTRKIHLDPRSPVVHFEYEFERVGESEIPLHVWKVTDLRKGDFMMMECDPRVLQPDRKPFKAWTSFTPEVPRTALLDGKRVLKVEWPPKGLKVGTYGRWVAMVRRESAFIQSMDYDPRGVYLDNSSLQTYINNSTGIYEIETLSPTWFLRKGERKSFHVQWALIDFTGGEKTDEQKARFFSNRFPGQIQK